MNNKIKLVRITTVPISLEKLLEGQLNYMQKYFDVYAVSSDKDRLYDFGEKKSIKVHHVNFTRKITPLRDLLAIYNLSKFLIKEKPEIVHTHTPKAGFIGMLASKISRTPIRLHTVAGLPLMEEKGFKKRILFIVEKITYLLASNIYPNSKGLYDYIVENKIINKNKLKIIDNGSTNGIDIDYFNPNLFSKNDSETLKNKIGIPMEHKIFLYVGRIVRDKGINELIAAFKKINDLYEKTSLLLVGSYEEDLDPLKDQTLKEINNNPNIHHIGYKKDVRLYFMISDILVFPSYREGFPNVVMQAGAMGVPAIVSDINGCNEIIHEGENGFIIPAKNSLSLYNAMDKSIQNKNIFKTKSSYRSEIVKKYNRKNVWKSLLYEYRMLLDKRKIKYNLNV